SCRSTTNTTVTLRSEEYPGIPAPAPDWASRNRHYFRSIHQLADSLVCIQTFRLRLQLVAQQHPVCLVHGTRASSRFFATTDRFCSPRPKLNTRATSTAHSGHISFSRIRI